MEGNVGEELVGDRPTKFIRPNFSATKLTLYQAKAYCKWLSELTGLSVSLATDAQWEYAARSRGQAVKYATDNGEIERGRNFKGEEYRWANYPPPQELTLLIHWVSMI